MQQSSRFVGSSGHLLQNRKLDKGLLVLWIQFRRSSERLVGLLQILQFEIRDSEPIESFRRLRIHLDRTPKLDCCGVVLPLVDILLAAIDKTLRALLRIAGAAGKAEQDSRN